MIKNQIATITIDDIGTDGEGIGKQEGYTLFVKGAVVGDVAKVRVLKAKKNYGYAKVEELLIPSPNRVLPKCPVAGKCGGCQLQQMSYESQLEYKANKVKNCMLRIGGISKEQLARSMEPVIGMEEPYYYRNKAQYPVGIGKDGRSVMGFYANHSHSIIECTDCAIQEPVNTAILPVIKAFMEEKHIPAYDELTGKGLVRHVLTRVGFHTKEVMVCIIINGRKFPQAAELAENVRKAVENHHDNSGKGGYILKSFCLNVNTEKTNVILGQEILPVYGETYITDKIGEIQYRISPLSFYQVNPRQTVKLYEKALEYADLSGNEIVWDLYCGIGTISLFFAQKAKQVYGVEIVPQAIEDAKVNSELNNITNAEFFAGAAEEVMPAKYKESGGTMKADVICVDPPRKGCEQSLLDTIASMEPKRIVYVSCDPATLARDVKYLGEKGYELKKVCPVDQFGHSTHVETVILLSRKKPDAIIEFDEFLESENGYRLMTLSVGVGEKPNLNEAQFKKLCKYVLDVQGIDGTTSEIMGSFSKAKKSPVFSSESDSDERIYELSERNHEVIQNLFSYGELAEQLPRYKERLKKDHFPHIWERLSLKTQDILAMAECLYCGVNDCNSADYAPICLEYCRALEVEMNEQIFTPFKNGVDVFRVAQRNYFYDKLKEAREMTLGECVFLLDKCTHPSHPLTELKRNIQTDIKQNRTLLGEAVDVLRSLNENVRRLSAHTTVMSYDELIETRQKVLGIGHLNLFYVLRDNR